MVELNDFAAVKTENATVFHASNLDVLPLMADNSVDSIVCDPPYELGFMGKSWDSTGIAYSVELWRECLRVLKPGGHLLAFSGSRTYHRMVVAIEDAGFEIRDMVTWISNKTFPKSHNIGKAIDKTDASIARRKRDFAFTSWMRSTELTASKANKILQDAKLISANGTVAAHYFAASQDAQPQVATKSIFDALRPYLPEVPEHIERMVAERTIESENFKKREVIGQCDVPIGHAFAGKIYSRDSSNKTINETAPATDEAKQWQGWGTALKPTVEPVVLARKPLDGTVAENVLRWGVGGLNIDASRIQFRDDADRKESTTKNQHADFASAPMNGNNTYGDFSMLQPKNYDPPGRWPANVMFDEACAELLDEQSGFSKSTGIINRWTNGAKPFGNGAGNDYESVQGVPDSGGASRFFYVARASKTDRNEGVESNTHPTVKPTDLMRYLIKLVTPAGGVVLDPFTGSGSTGKAALLDGYKFLGIELTADYLPIIEGRLKWAEAEAQREKQAAAEKENEVLF